MKQAVKLMTLVESFPKTGSLLKAAGAGFAGFIKAVAVAKPLLPLLRSVCVCEACIPMTGEGLSVRDAMYRTQASLHNAARACRRAVVAERPDFS